MHKPPGSGENGLGDIQKRGCRYTTREFLPASASWSRAEPTSQIRTRGISRFGTTQPLLRDPRPGRSASHPSRLPTSIVSTLSDKWYWHPRDNNLPGPGVPKKRASRETPPTLFRPPAQALVSGFFFTGREKTAKDLREVVDAMGATGGWPHPKMRRRPGLMFWEGRPAGYDTAKGTAGNGIGIFHPDAYNTG